MSATQLVVTAPEQLAEHLRSGPVKDALAQFARLAGTELTIAEPSAKQSLAGSDLSGAGELPLRYRGETVGQVTYPAGGDAPPAAQAVTTLVEHMLEREVAVDDLAQALMTSYEELNLLYTLLPNIATKVDPREIGDVLVAETARTLRCRRVSLLVLDDKQDSYRVLASRGLSAEVANLSLPLAGSIAAHALWDDDLLIVNDLADRPDLARLSRGDYESSSFAVVRVPLQARGEALGFLTVTERLEAAEFTAHDRKLLEGLSAMGASALLNCRLHAAVNRQMLSTIHALASAVDAKDQYTHDHAGRVAGLCVATARELGVSDAATLREVELAGLLHDIGKIGIPDAILTKPAGLTSAEFATIQNHVEIGARIIENVPGLEGVTKAILHHHERYDGLGYPGGLAGDAIPLSSSLIATSDVFDALTSTRPYRDARPAAEAIRELNRCKGTQLDPAVVDALVAVVKRGGDLPRPTGEHLAESPTLATAAIR